MSTISNDTISKAITEITEYAKTTKPRNFLETIEFQFALKNFDPSRDRRIVGSVQLPHIAKPKFKVCLLGSAQHCNEAKVIGIDSLNEEDLIGFKKNKKKVKKLAKKYDAFMASSDLIKKIPKLLGPGLNRAGKFPVPIDSSETVADKLKVVKSTVKYNIKFKSGMPMTLNFPFGFLLPKFSQRKDVERGNSAKRTSCSQLHDRSI
ncbi:60S ribosomal protein L10A, variant 2 [Bonamia ostreae]|uniref:Ribosomal protein n=1 Tax=Bonamia ostreae TaxID=126728 RepID=A0ABV2AQY9_9EUKA